MKKRLSANFKIGKLFIIPLILVLATVNYHFFTVPNNMEDHTAMLVVPGLSLVLLMVGAFVFRYLDQIKIISFDENQIYIANKKRVEVVALEKISALKMTTTYLNNNYGCKIIYTDNDNVEKSIHFFPRIMYWNMQQFAELILKNNKDAIVQKFFLGPFQIDKSNN